MGNSFSLPRRTPATDSQQCLVSNVLSASVRVSEGPSPIEVWAELWLDHSSNLYIYMQASISFFTSPFASKRFVKEFVRQAKSQRVDGLFGFKARLADIEMAMATSRRRFVCADLLSLV
jgi:hypothetical protein